MPDWIPDKKETDWIPDSGGSADAWEQDAPTNDQMKSSMMTFGEKTAVAGPFAAAYDKVMEKITGTEQERTRSYMAMIYARDLNLKPSFAHQYKEEIDLWYKEHPENGAKRDAIMAKIRRYNDTGIEGDAYLTTMYKSLRRVPFEIQEAAGGVLNFLEENADPYSLGLRISAELKDDETHKKVLLAAADAWDAKQIRLGPKVVASAQKEKKAWEADVIPGSFKDVVGMATGTTVNNLILLATLGPMGRSAYLTGFGTQAFGQSYTEQRKGGSSKSTATLASLINAGSEVATEFIPAGIYLKPSRRLVEQFVKAQLAEIPGESINQVINDVVDKCTIRPDMTLAEAIDNVVTTIQVTFLSTGALATTTHGVNKVLSKTLEPTHGDIVKQEVDKALLNGDTPQAALKKGIDAAAQTADGKQIIDDKVKQLKKEAADFEKERGTKPFIIGTEETAQGDVSKFIMADPVTGRTFEVAAISEGDAADGNLRMMPDREAVAAELNKIRTEESQDITLDKFLNGEMDVDEFVQTAFGEDTDAETKTIYHGTDQAFDDFDVSKSADGSIWFTDNKSKIEQGEVVASGQGRIIERLIDEKKLKLGGWAESDKYSTDELIAQGYDGLKLEDADETTYQIFNPSKLGLPQQEGLTKPADDATLTTEEIEVFRNEYYTKQLEAEGIDTAAIKESGGDIMEGLRELSVRAGLNLEAFENGFRNWLIARKETLEKEAADPNAIGEGKHVTPEVQAMLDKSVAEAKSRTPAETEARLAARQADLLDKVKKINDDIGEKGSIDLEPIVNLGRSIWEEGHTSYKAFEARAKELLADVWDKVKQFIKDAWDIINNERGSFSTKKIEPIGFNDMPAVKAEMKKLQREYLTGNKDVKAQVRKNLLWMARRLESLRNVRDSLNLTEAQMKKVSRRNPVLMGAAEYKKYLADVEQRAVELADTRFAKMALIKLIEEKRLRKADNYRRAQGLPSIEQMTEEQLNQFFKLLEPFQDDDVFLTQRELEMVDRSDLKGIRTWREARERLAERADVLIEKLWGYKETKSGKKVPLINIETMDNIRYDSILWQKDAFTKVLVEDMTTAMLGANLNAHNIESEIYKLAKAAQRSRKRSLVEKAIPQDEIVMQYLEAAPGGETAAALAKNMTPEELNWAHYIQSYFRTALEYLMTIKALERGREGYITHIRRSFLENLKDEGMKGAIENTLKNYAEDELSFRILDDDTGKILPLEKFFQYAMHRTGELTPSKNVTRVFLTYMTMFEKKKAFDAIIPKLDIFAQSLTPERYTPRGLEMDRTLKNFVNKWINNKKGRKISYDSVWRQGGTLDLAVRALRTFTTIWDLGFNIFTGVSSLVGEQVANFTMLASKGWALGATRMRTDQGKKILKKYETFTNRSLWEEFTAPGQQINQRLGTALMGLFHIATTAANKQFLLGSLTEAEWNSGTISTERLAQMRLEMGRFRVVGGTSSIIGSTTVGDAATQYKGWAIPIMGQTIRNIGTLIKDLQAKKPGEALTTKEAGELRRIAGVGIAVVIIGALVMSDDHEDKRFSELSFVDKFLARIYREAMTLTQGWDPTMWIMMPRTMQFLSDLAISLKQIALLETYKTSGLDYKEGELKGVRRLKRQFTPAAVRGLQNKEKKQKW